MAWDFGHIGGKRFNKSNDPYVSDSEVYQESSITPMDISQPEFYEELPSSGADFRRMEDSASSDIPLIDMKKLLSSHESTDAPTQRKPSTWDQIKAGDIKGLANELGIGLEQGLSKTGSAKQDIVIADLLASGKDPVMAEIGKRQLSKIQDNQKYLKDNQTDSLPAMIGEQIPQIPLWMTGEAAVGIAGKGLTKLSPRIASTAEKVGSKLPDFVKGGLKDALSYGSVVAPTEVIQQGGNLQDLIDKEKQVPSIALGGSLARGALKGIGKSVEGARDVLKPRGVPLEPITRTAAIDTALQPREPIRITSPRQETSSPRIELPTGGPLNRFRIKPDQRIWGSDIPGEQVSGGGTVGGIPKVGDSVAPIGEPVKPLTSRSAAASIESPSSVMRLKGPDTVKDFPQGDIPAGLKERGVSENIRTDANRPDALRDSYSVDPLVYKQLGNKEVLAKAQSIFDKGLEPAISELDTLIKDLRPEAAPLVKLIGDHLTKNGDIVRARELMSNAANRATESGQFGQAFRILRDADAPTLMMTFDKQLAKLNKEGLETYGKKWNNVDLTPDELTMVGNIERGNQASYDSAFEQIQARIADEMPATAMEKINAYRHISMLLNPKTHIRNIGGNAIMMGMRKAAQRTSGAIQKVFLKESDRTQSILVNKEYKDLAKEYFEANNKELLGGSNKFQEGISLNMPDKRVFRKSRIGEAFGKDIDIAEKTRKFNYSLLQKGDNPFFRNAYEDRLASYAQAKGVKDFTKLSQEAFDIARSEAEQATYKDASMIADFINKAKRPSKDAGIVRKGGAILVEAALPFTKTPINIIKRGLQYSPIGVANGIGGIISQKTATAAIDELAKGLTGTGVLGLGYLLASKGILTGKASKDVDLKAYDSNTGNYPFSILGKYSFDWAVPLAVPLSIGVEVYNAIKDKPEDVAKMNSIIEKNDSSKLGEIALTVSNGIMEGLNASGDTVFNMSIMKGIKTLLGSGTKGFMEGVAQLPQGYATQFIPTLSSQLAGTVDPLVRQTYVKGDMPQSFKNALISRVPLASTKLEPKQTPFGEDMKKIENPIGRAFSQFLSPGIITKDQGIDPKIDTELRRLNDVEGLKTQFPTMVPNYIEKTQTHPRITLTPEEATQYQKRVGELTLSAFTKTIGSGSYKSLKPNKAKGKTIDEVKADLLAEKIADAKALAKKEILKKRGLK